MSDQGPPLVKRLGFSVHTWTTSEGSRKRRVRERALRVKLVNNNLETSVSTCMMLSGPVPWVKCWGWC